MSLWTRATAKDLTLAEKALLDKYGCDYEKQHVPCGPNGEYINTIICGSGEPLVLIHGFGAGVGFWFKVMKDLSSRYKVYAIDMLGMGGSARCKFKAKTVEEAESFFVESIEEWRKAIGLQTFILAGHSFGGYMSTCYTHKYPQNVSILLLLSPVGVPEPPSADATHFQGPAPWQLRMLRSVFKTLWNWGVTPQGLCRFMGPAGHWLVGKFTKSRFVHMTEEEKELLQLYIHQISAAEGSSEYALNIILQPGAYARSPLVRRLPDLQVRTVFFYGSKDWMDKTAAVEVSPRMKSAEVVIISQAGHHLYFDNPEEFVSAILGALQSR
eukprot:GILI01013622.1.p1 GENE.GILI01013622.1~~GILI01013622.1.p1  ORF type:complete len:326 (-),score=53.31 GILI01013622.1:183-1160(-)